MRFTCLAIAAFAVLGITSRNARADDSNRQHSHFTVGVEGGMLLPQGTMKDSTNTSLDFAGRFGWTGSSGLGLVVNLEYAPLSTPSVPLTTISSNFGAATAGVRFTIGHKTLRVWFAAGGGMVYDRVHTEITGTAGILSTTNTDEKPAFDGSAGAMFHLFSNGGLAVTATYLRSFSGSSVYNYVTLGAGLVFTM
jgi:hypothetical protein